MLKSAIIKKGQKSDPFKCINIIYKIAKYFAIVKVLINKKFSLDSMPRLIVQKYRLRLTVKISQILCISAFLLLVLPSPILSVSQPKSANTMADSQFHKGLESFGIRLFSELVKNNQGKNIVFSPFSIQTCIAMARMGAEGKTAQEMDQGLALTVQNPEELANIYHAILELYENSPILKIANKIYVMENYEVQEKFNELLSKQFFSAVESVNFAKREEAANTINTWVENKTNNLIKDLISPQILGVDTRLVLVNAIHFKGEWLYQFPERATREMDFYLDETNTVKVQMMHINERFNYGEFPELDATALEMRYKNSDLSMLIILPNSRTGLADLEEKLKNVSLPDLTKRMFNTKVIVDMPKFKAEFEVELNEALKNLGMNRMFTDQAEFSKMLKSAEPLRVSKVIHKAFIEVNEKGTEAAAATAIVMELRTMHSFEEQPKYFTINKSYYYVIINKKKLVLFKGTVNKF
ncbi:antichymotrypsin-2-like isoform X2 [Lucilia cuprina]|uniref:antichymotrypsin-2-like isoform X2 n=1 Tax=Lucilia cuprina TaxID=7375 RepID=UPI001F064A7D|nr:antichymotrypsin-2-like isoform X2 [Lucilia cuprina]